METIKFAKNENGILEQTIHVNGKVRVDFKLFLSLERAIEYLKSNYPTLDIQLTHETINSIQKGNAYYIPKSENKDFLKLQASDVCIGYYEVGSYLTFDIKTVYETGTWQRILEANSLK